MMFNMNEQTLTDNFVKLVGGRTRADQLFRILQSSYPTQGRWGEKISKNEVFRMKAKREGFADKEINAILRLQ